MNVDIGSRIAPHFPIAAGLVQLEVVTDTGGFAGGDGGDDVPRAVAVVRLIISEERDGLRSVRDIKEQQIYMGWPVLYDDADRVAAFFAALGDVLGEIAEAGGTEVFECLMPHDLLDAGALKLKRARSRDDFSAALRAKSRLGRYIR